MSPPLSSIPRVLAVGLVTWMGQTTACGDDRGAPATSGAAVSMQRAQSGQAGDEPTHEYKRPYEFTTDWFSPAIPTWKQLLAPYSGQADLRYLEVGIFQGRSFFWVLENIATHSSSRLTGIDVELKYIRKNLGVSGAADRIELLKGRSQTVLGSLPPDSYDIIYIDGSHRGDDALVDAVLSWPLLKAGGTLIFDDYAWHVEPSVVSDLVLPAELRPKEAIDTFVTLFRDQLEVVHRKHQLIARKKNPLCAGKDAFYCSPIGDHVFDWRKREVRDPRTGALLEVTAEELEIIEALLLDMRLGEDRVSIPRSRRRNEAYRDLAKKLNLERAINTGR